MNIVILVTHDSKIQTQSAYSNALESLGKNNVFHSSKIGETKKEHKWLETQNNLTKEFHSPYISFSTGHLSEVEIILNIFFFFSKFNFFKQIWAQIVQILCGERICMNFFLIQKICQILAFSRIMNFQNLLNSSKVTLFFLLFTKKQFKNEQKVYWLEEDYMEMMMMIVVRNQSRIIST